LSNHVCETSGHCSDADSTPPRLISPRENQSCHLQPSPLCDSEGENIF
jgi:hypothetical protein